MDGQPTYDLPDRLDAIIRRLQALVDDPAAHPEVVKIVADLLRDAGLIYRSD